MKRYIKSVMNMSEFEVWDILFEMGFNPYMWQGFWCVKINGQEKCFSSINLALNYIKTK